MPSESTTESYAVQQQSSTVESTTPNVNEIPAKPKQKAVRCTATTNTGLDDDCNNITSVTASSFPNAAKNLTMLNETMDQISDLITSSTTLVPCKFSNVSMFDRVEESTESAFMAHLRSLCNEAKLFTRSKERMDEQSRTRRGIGSLNPALNRKFECATLQYLKKYCYHSNATQSTSPMITHFPNGGPFGALQLFSQIGYSRRCEASKLGQQQKIYHGFQIQFHKLIKMEFPVPCTSFNHDCVGCLTNLCYFAEVTKGMTVCASQLDGLLYSSLTPGLEEMCHIYDTTTPTPVTSTPLAIESPRRRGSRNNPFLDMVIPLHDIPRIDDDETRAVVPYNLIINDPGSNPLNSQVSIDMEIELGQITFFLGYKNVIGYLVQQELRIKISLGEDFLHGKNSTCASCAEN
ncbi:unnamed protein product [Orchesella dallaii]|uniref:Uncharacterized protein n=1 Tax=Orchesella dallaii TaxID=48710 RepID=A0ABP1R1Z4_9HEXA